MKITKAQRHHLMVYCHLLSLYYGTGITKLQAELWFDIVLYERA